MPSTTNWNDGVGQRERNAIIHLIARRQIIWLAIRGRAGFLGHNRQKSSRRLADPIEILPPNRDASRCPLPFRLMASGTNRKRSTI